MDALASLTSGHKIYLTNIIDNLFHPITDNDFHSELQTYLFKTAHKQLDSQSHIMPSTSGSSHPFRTAFAQMYSKTHTMSLTDVSYNDPSRSVSHTGDMITERTFTLFPKLLPELRVMIWGFVAHTPRIVEIHHLHPHPLTFGSSPRSNHYSFTAPPITLQVNKESRHEGLKYYKLSFGAGREPQIYFNPWADTLYLSDRKIQSNLWLFIISLSTSELALVRSLALDERVAAEARRHSMGKNLLEFHNLEHLMIVTQFLAVSAGDDVRTQFLVPEDGGEPDHKKELELTEPNHASLQPGVNLFRYFFEKYREDVLPKLPYVKHNQRHHFDFPFELFARKMHLIESLRLKIPKRAARQGHTREF